MKVGIAKEATAFRGGFELLVERIERSLLQRGHDIVRLQPLPSPDGRELSIPEEIRSQLPDYFRYMNSFDSFQNVSTDVDVVLSTQPPSQAVRHANHVALFYHHFRIYYDLSDLWISAGFCDEEVHALAKQSIRRVDAPSYSDVARFLAGSETVRRRLQHFNETDDRTSVLLAPLLRPMPDRTELVRGGHVLCVSRHEFPKRTELVSAAMKLISDERAILVGDGGRRGWVVQRDAEWTRMQPSDVSSVPPENIWLKKHGWIPDAEVDVASNVQFTGWVSDEELNRLYRMAVCVVAPAYDEDYGLTALEAMAYGKPVIVCSDGGGLAELVRAADSGLVVAPDHNAIASGITRLCDDTSVAERFAQNGRDFAANLDWSDYIDSLEATLENQR